ncbi:MAG: ankyrin repeat domain-containing protein [Planctomycetota bacterium]|jgi:pectate lyase
MRSKYRAHPIVKVILLAICLACLAAGNLHADEDSKYLDAVREFADNVLKHGLDTYGPKHTPLFVDGLMVRDPNDPNYGKDGVFKPVEWIAPNGDRWVLSNLASQQNLFRTLDGLTKITGDPKYRQAAVEAIEYAFANLRSPNGLLYWGGHSAYDAAEDKVYGGNRPHELKAFYPYYQLMWDVDPQATKQFIEAFWSAHILDWSNLDMNRHGNFGERLERPWEHEYKGGSVFFKSKVSWTTSFSTTGSDLSYAAAILYKLSGQKEPLTWAKRLVRRYVETRHPKTGISAIVYNFKNPPYQLMEDFEEHFHDPRTTIFPVSPFVSPLRNRSPVLPIYPWMCNFLLGEMLDEEGKELQQWALEELSAWGKASYRREDNAWVPILTDGTCIEEYVCKKDGNMCPKGGVAKAVPADSLSLWAYSLAYRKTSDDFMWQMVRNIASGNGFGEIGKNPKDEPKLKTRTYCSDPYALLAFLELHRKTHKGIFLDMACRLGDNILSDRSYKAFFVRSKKHVYARFDDFEPLALLRLEVARRVKPISLPVVWPSRAFFDSTYAGRGVRSDVYLIYSLTESPDPPKSLHDAAVSGDVQELKALISHGVDVNIRERDVSAPLHRAAQHGHMQLVEILLAEGADIDVGDSMSATPLHYAAEKGHKEIAELLIANGADVNARNSAGNTPLHYAARSRDVGQDIIELLIAKSADVNAKDDDGQTPVDVAVSRNRKEVMKLLVEKGADVSLHTAARIGALAKVKSLIGKGADINAKDTSGQTPLHYAVEYGHKDVVELLIVSGADLNVKNKDGNAPGHVALGKNNSAILDLLIAKGVDVSSIHLAAYLGDTAKVMNFIEKGSDVNTKNQRGLTPLHYAARRGHKEIVEVLLANGADVDARDRTGRTPAERALLDGHNEIIELLISNGADVYPLYLAVSMRDLDKVRRLIRDGADVNKRTQYGTTAIQIAAVAGFRDIAELLIDKGADVNAGDSWDWTSLHSAAEKGHRELAELLIAKGANVNARDGGGRTPLWYAQNQGYTEIVELLRKHGAKE